MSENTKPVPDWDSILRAAQTTKSVVKIHTVDGSCSVGVIDVITDDWIGLDDMAQADARWVANGQGTMIRKKWMTKLTSLQPGEATEADWESIFEDKK